MALVPFTHSGEEFSTTNPSMHCWKFVIGPNSDTPSIWHVITYPSHHTTNAHTHYHIVLYLCQQRLLRIHHLQVDRCPSPCTFSFSPGTIFAFYSEEDCTFSLFLLMTECTVLLSVDMYVSKNVLLSFTNPTRTLVYPFLCTFLRVQQNFKHLTKVQFTTMYTKHIVSRWFTWRSLTKSMMQVIE